MGALRAGKLTSGYCPGMHRDVHPDFVNSPYICVSGRAFVVLYLAGEPNKPAVVRLLLSTYRVSYCGASPREDTHAWLAIRLSVHGCVFLFSWTYCGASPKEDTHAWLAIRLLSVHGGGVFLSWTDTFVAPHFVIYVC